MKKENIPDFKKLQPVPDAFKHFPTSEIHQFFKETSDSDFCIKEIIECQLSDISVIKDSDDIHKIISIAGHTEHYSINNTGASELCKLCKIPFEFGCSIPIGLFDTNILELKNINDRQELKVIIDNTNTIVNISTKKNHLTEYFSKLIEWLQKQFIQGEDGVYKHTKYPEFFIHSAHLSSIGYYILFASHSPKHQFELNKDRIYLGAKILMGDFYHKSSSLNLYSAVLNKNVDSFLYFKDFGVCSSYKLSYKKKDVHEVEKYYTALTDSIGLDVLLGLNISTIKDIYSFCSDAPLSFSLFNQTQRKLKSKYDEDTLCNFYCIEPDKLELINQEQNFILDTHSFTDRGKKLMITGIKDTNSSVIADMIGLLSKQMNADIDEMNLLNDAATNILINTYACKVKDVFEMNG